MSDNTGTFDTMLDPVFHQRETLEVAKIFANRYAKQNIRELPGIFEIGSLGAIWFTDMWDGNRQLLYVDSDPSWVAFIDAVADWIVNGYCDIVIFYWT